MAPVAAQRRASTPLVPLKSVTKALRALLSNVLEKDCGSASVEAV